MSLLMTGYKPITRLNNLGESFSMRLTNAHEVGVFPP